MEINHNLSIIVLSLYIPKTNDLPWSNNNIRSGCTRSTSNTYQYLVKFRYFAHISKRMIMWLFLRISLIILVEDTSTLIGDTAPGPTHPPPHHPIFLFAFPFKTEVKLRTETHFPSKASRGVTTVLFYKEFFCIVCLDFFHFT